MFLFFTFLTSSNDFDGKQWQHTKKFKRVLDGESIILFEPEEQEEFHYLSRELQQQLKSVLMTGIRAEASDSVLLLTGTKKGQFSIDTKATLLRFRPLLERAISDIEYKEELQQLVNIKTRELSIAQQQAEQANESKSQFLAMMSHELRTPLNAVLGLIDVLRQKSSTEQCLLLEQMENSAELLLIIINDILDVSRIESGHFKLQCNWINLDKQLRHSLSYNEQLAIEKDIQFHIEQDIDTSSNYWLDPTRLTQILYNVVGNAIKFTGEGKVSVKLTTYKQELLEIVVTDTGIGIDQSRLEQLFSPFIQADNSITRNYGGTGLGLTITKYLVDMMDGDIHIESHVGKGTQFSIRIPLQSQTPSIVPGIENNTNKTAVLDNIEHVKSSFDDVRSKTHHILVVEDTKTNQMVIKLLLTRMGYQVSLANNGLEAIDLLSRDHNYDLVFMDLSMPVMDGIEATRLIREKHILIPIIALTAHAMNQEKASCMNVGMNDFVMKPIRTQDLNTILQQYLG